MRKSKLRSDTNDSSEAAPLTCMTFDTANEAPYANNLGVQIMGKRNLQGS